MSRQEVSRLSLPPDWDPASTARAIETEVGKKWDQGWVFVRAETDAIMESVCLYFEWPEDAESSPP